MDGRGARRLPYFVGARRWTTAGTRRMQDQTGPADTSETGLTVAEEAIAAGTVGRWLRAVSKFGLVCRAAVYLLVGYLTLRLAFAAGGRTVEPASGTGALQEAALAPLGSSVAAAARRRLCGVRADPTGGSDLSACTRRQQN